MILSIEKYILSQFTDFTTIFSKIFSLAQAMQTYSDSLRHPVFVIVTDDPEWAVSSIPASFRPRLTGFYDPRDPDSAGLDLAALSLCNHLVLSRWQNYYILRNNKTIMTIK